MLILIGTAWFTLSCVIFVVLITIEQLSGHTPALTEGVGLLLYFGVYFGSWLVMAVGGFLAFIGYVISRSRQNP
jgi:hypothetical protein